MIFNRDDSTGGADRCWWRVCDTDLRRLVAPEHSSATTLMLSLIVSELASLALGDCKVPLRCLDPELRLILHGLSIALHRLGSELRLSLRRIACVLRHLVFALCRLAPELCLPLGRFP
ncbi:hypothetical protein PF005_g4907 [Phytophthora fragariae]|uniref:Uncharacterized protein n=1 Tax=Phytophthora fragariae TaxID=53985 RepID=A0A6A3FTA4_9STRA|nr:hypothetical protein PF003_g18691 [Phytophthora fragariae]KAE8944928.1 hypothetical protein PF009_g5402 [Phytophthora fragariae]KAE9022290.1 hypothetical protein PF011_g4539 [Phytophthora fragariae]KAE9129099.1 hypothetical protein PF010_g4263 [Phytophthora fragariae]KAE9129334.1 hypothetical protein PF007_g4917 [Phytophthora fragariae]